MTARILVALALVVVATSCGQPNASDVPGALASPASSPTPTLTPTPAPPPVSHVTPTPCTHGKTKVTKNGLKITDTECGAGPEAVSGSTIKVKYIGKLGSGQVFDSTKRSNAGKPVATTIGVGRLIPGWDQGIPGMRVGGVRKLVIPPDLGYGSAKNGPIPPNSTLLFTIKLVAVKP